MSKNNMNKSCESSNGDYTKDNCHIDSKNNTDRYLHLNKYHEKPSSGEVEPKRKAEDYIVSSGRKYFFSIYYNIFLRYLKKISLKKDIDKDIVEYLLNITYNYAGRKSPTVINECRCGVKECKNSTPKETHIRVSHKCLLEKLNNIYNILVDLSTDDEHMLYVYLYFLSPLLGVLIFWSQSSNKEYSDVSNKLLNIF